MSHKDHCSCAELNGVIIVNKFASFQKLNNFRVHAERCAELIVIEQKF